MVLKRDFVPKVSWCNIHNIPVMSHVLLSNLAEAGRPSAHHQACSLANTGINNREGIVKL